MLLRGDLAFCCRDGVVELEREDADHDGDEGVEEEVAQHPLASSVCGVPLSSRCGEECWVLDVPVTNAGPTVFPTKLGVRSEASASRRVYRRPGSVALRR